MKTHTNYFLHNILNFAVFHTSIHSSMNTELDLADLGLPVTLKLEIEGKLKELDVYIDEELPDYILVLLANKKSQAQMCKDLRLFFGSLTETFVQWLHSSVKEMKTELKDKQTENCEVRKKEIEENSNPETKVAYLLNFMGCF